MIAAGSPGVDGMREGYFDGEKMVALREEGKDEGGGSGRGVGDQRDGK